MKLPEPLPCCAFKRVEKGIGNDSLAPAVKYPACSHAEKPPMVANDVHGHIR